MADPKKELGRIRQEARDKCHLYIPREASEKDINAFIDRSLQHNVNSMNTSYSPYSCDMYTKVLEHKQGQNRTYPQNLSFSFLVQYITICYIYI